MGVEGDGRSRLQGRLALDERNGGQKFVASLLEKYRGIFVSKNLNQLKQHRSSKLEIIAVAAAFLKSELKHV